MPLHTSTWIVVADAGRARILYLERPGSPVHRVFEEDNASARRFEVADVVNEMAARRGFDRLILVASRRTLAMLLEALSEEARACIVFECEQNLTRFSDEMVLQVLAERSECPLEASEEDDAGAEGEVGGSEFQGSRQ